MEANVTLRFGVIGLSDGNGHPYSWSAIFNGYDPVAMESCGFPVIPRYLENQTWPDDAISVAKVTHIWTQDMSLSEKVAKASYIANIVMRPEDMIGQIDAVLLARDDSETHYELAAPFIKAGLPIYIDKPICLTLRELEAFYALQQYPGQIFTCSGLRYAREFEITAAIRAKVGQLLHIYATTPKDWEKYAVHVIEPLLLMVGDQGELLDRQIWRHDDAVIANLCWESGFQATISALGKAACPLGFRLIGETGWHDMQFLDTFSAFKGALSDFVAGVINREVRTDQAFVRRVVEVIEVGMKL